MPPLMRKHATASDVIPRSQSQIPTWESVSRVTNSDEEYSRTKQLDADNDYDHWYVRSEMREASIPAIRRFPMKLKSP